MLAVLSAGKERRINVVWHLAEGIVEGDCRSVCEGREFAAGTGQPAIHRDLRPAIRDM